MSRGTLFFDYDGTLHNSMAIYGPAFRRAYSWLVEEGYRKPQKISDEWISQWLGFTVEQMWTTYAPDLPETVWRKAASLVAYEMDSRTDAGQARLFDGIPEALTAVKEAGFELAVLSNCRTKYLETHRRMFQLDQWFDAYYWAEAYHDIPKWSIYQRISSTQPKPHIMIGDRFHDQEVSLKSGIPFVACAWGFARDGELDQVSAWAKAPADLLSIVAELVQV